MSLTLLAQALPAMAAVAPFHSVMWAVSPHLWVIEAVGALLPFTRITKGRHLHEILGTCDQTYPTLAAHLQALRGQRAEYEITYEGRRWKGAVVPVELHGKLLGAIGTAVLDEAARGPDISICIAADEEHGIRPGDYVYEDRRRPVVLQRVLPPAAITRLRAEGKVLPLSLPSPIASPAAASPPGLGAAPRNRPGLALVRSG